MLALGIESSGERASSCLVLDGKVIVNVECALGLTHSETLLPIIKQVFDLSKKWTINDVDVICISAGPGSFTGLRIGESIAKGLALPHNIKILNVSTLDSLRYNIKNNDRFVIPIMDARCDRVFFNLGKYFNDSACEIETLVSVLNEHPEIKIEFVGDGCDAYDKYFEENLKIDYILANKNVRYQSAISNVFVALANKTINNINYLEKPQAEKELENKNVKVK